MLSTIEPRLVSTLAILALLSFTPVAAAAPLQGGPPPSAVRVDAAQLETVQDRRQVTGEVRAIRRSTVAVREAGLVAELLVREGERVEAGQIIARLDAARIDLEEALVIAQEIENAALVEERTSDVASAQRELDVLTELFERDALNPKELADAGTVLRRQKARLAQAEAAARVLAAQRSLLNRRRADLEARAPFAGMVVTRHTEVGEWITTGGAVAEVLTDDALEASLEVPQAYLAALRQHRGPLFLTLDVGDGREVAVDDWRIVPTIQRSGRSFQVLVPLPSNDTTDPKAPAAADGASLTASIPNGKEAELITLARGSVLLGDTGPYVFVARPGAEGGPAVADLVPVQVLFPTGPRVAVRSARLAAGDQIVIEGNERLFPGAPLLPQPAGEASESEQSEQR